ncbi:MAG: putative transcriptional regulator, partial [Halieaceae bacterium]
MAKRELFNELMDGIGALTAEREGKITLKTTELKIPKPIKLSASKITKIRKQHNCSQAVFARLLATNVSTLRNWEQGRSEPNAQAKVLLKMVDS